MNPCGSHWGRGVAYRCLSASIFGVRRQWTLPQTIDLKAMMESRLLSTTNWQTVPITARRRPGLLSSSLISRVFLPPRVSHFADGLQERACPGERAN